jgi:hypothetical protein
MKAELAKIENHLREHGLLMVMSNDVPSYVTLITEESVKGSWWGHPKGNFIYNSLNVYLDKPDILAVKLLDKKLTLVCKDHWDALFAAANSKEEWQTRGLSAAHLDLLNKVQDQETVRTDEISSRYSITELGKLASKLEERLLIYSESVHTDSGKHARQLMTWTELMKHRSYSPRSFSAVEYKLYFDFVMASMAMEADLEFAQLPKFPWE